MPRRNRHQTISAERRDGERHRRSRRRELDARKRHRQGVPA